MSAPLVAIVVCAVAILIAAPAAVATADGLTLDPSAFIERGHELFTGPTPSFDGSAEADEGPVTVQVYAGTSTSGTPIQEIEAEVGGSETWRVGPLAALSGGTYTVQVEQFDFPFKHVEDIGFNVDASPPQVTLTSPANGSSTSGSSQVFSGSAGTEAGDLETITVDLYAGSTVAGAQLQTVSTQRSNEHWSASFGGLGPGTYTAQAEQSDDVGNTGRSGPVTFTVPAPAPPAASFEWIPSAPHTGEPVTLVSTSTDAGAAITGFAWAPAGNGVFAAGASALATSFPTPGAHVVQLRVTDANGLSSTVAETIPVTSPAAKLMAPFPVVRIAGSYTSTGAKISVLTVLAPVGATVRVTCRGGGCSTRSQKLIARSHAKHRTGTVLITFRRFERSLQAGAVLGVWVSNHGQIGKFTRFRIRHGKPPSRTDLCLNPAGTSPILCPS